MVTLAPCLQGQPFQNLLLPNERQVQGMVVDLEENLLPGSKSPLGNPAPGPGMLNAISTQWKR